MSCRTHSSQAGFLPRWAEPVRRMTWTRHTLPRPGLPQATNPMPKSPAGTSTISICSLPTLRPTMPSFKIASSRSAPSYRASRSRLEHAPAQRHRLERNDFPQDLLATRMIIRWNGRPVEARPGDTIATALWRHGIRALGYSRKRHRPLGASGHVVQGALVTVDGRPHVHADHTVVVSGMEVSQQGSWPHPRFDLLKLARRLPQRWTRGGFERPYWLRSGTKRFELWERLLMSLAGEVDPPTFRA